MLTLDELIALIFITPVLLAASYSLIVIFWIYIEMNNKVQRIWNWLKEKE
jgi:hypothetical protein